MRNWYDKMKIKKIKSCNYYHQTNEWSAKSIMQNGFNVEEGGNQRYTEGVYMSNHSGGSFGDVTLKVCFSGKFLDFSNDNFGNEWTLFKRKYWKGSYTKLTQDIKDDYPNVDGIIFESIAVIWYPNKITKIDYL